MDGKEMEEMEMQWKGMGREAVVKVIMNREKWGFLWDGMEWVGMEWERWKCKGRVMGVMGVVKWGDMGIEERARDGWGRNGRGGITKSVDGRVMG